MKGHYSKSRMGFVILAFSSVFILFFLRLIFVQVIKGHDYREKAQRQYLQSMEIPAVRGDIYDCRGRKVAANMLKKSLFAYPLDQDGLARTYGQLAYILDRPDRAVQSQYPLTPKKFRWIKRGLTLDEIVRFESLHQPEGIFLRDEPARYYPYGTVGRGVLGFVDIDNHGKAGIELVMDDHLAGEAGRAMVQRDGQGREYNIQEVPLKNAVAGGSIILTVDWDKQQIVEKELAAAVEKYHARSGMAVFINPHTGAIIAAADHYPGEDDDEKPMKLDAVCGTFEPGSVFKLITAAAALEDGRVKPSDRFDAEQGRWRLGRHLLRDDHKYDELTFRSAFELSSNIVMGKVANEIGGDKVLAMAKKMGFGRKTNSGLHGESKGVVERPKRWSQFVTSTFAIGHGVSVTALQLAQAFAIVASGGQLNEPYFVAGCINSNGDIVDKHESHPLKVLDTSVVAELHSFLRGVVISGTGEPLAKAPINIAGKTGTGEKPNLETGGYDKNKYTASFAGYFPADSPLVAGIVVLDEPEPIHYGGYTSGPAFMNIAAKFAALDNYCRGQVSNLALSADTNQIAREETADNLSLPDLVGKSRRKAEAALAKSGLNGEFIGSGDRVLATHPPPEAFVQKNRIVRCYFGPGEDQPMTVPDLAGLTIREAVSLLDRYGLILRCQGHGRVFKQNPAAGASIPGNGKVEINCRASQEVRASF